MESHERLRHTKEDVQDIYFIVYHQPKSFVIYKSLETSVAMIYLVRKATISKTKNQKKQTKPIVLVLIKCYGQFLIFLTSGLSLRTAQNILRILVSSSFLSRFLSLCLTHSFFLSLFL